MHDGQSLGASGSTRLVGVPRLLAVVAEVHATSGTLAVQLRTTGAAAGDYCVPNDTQQHSWKSYSVQHLAKQPSIETLQSEAYTGLGLVGTPQVCLHEIQEYCGVKV